MQMIMEIQWKLKITDFVERFCCRSNSFIARTLNLPLQQCIDMEIDELEDRAAEYFKTEPLYKILSILRLPTEIYIPNEVNDIQTWVYNKYGYYMITYTYIKNAPTYQKLS